MEKKNIVLLPDSLVIVDEENYFADKKGKTLIGLMEESLLEKKVSFGFVDCDDEKKLVSLGALKNVKNEIIEFQDKPKEDFKKYNTFWAVYAFQKDYGKPLYEFLVRSIKHENAFYEKEIFYPAGGVDLSAYIDLGTWDAIENFRKEYKNYFFKIG